MKNGDSGIKFLKFKEMKIAICTISTKHHLFKSYALFDSIMKYSEAAIFCLVSDSNEVEKKKGVQFHTLADLQSETAQQIKEKYKKDKLRWALKSVYVKFLLENGYDKVIYVDNDIYFHSSPDFLFEKLNTADFLLTPHFYKADPTKEQNWLEANFRSGLYNAGFFGASKQAIPILDWWARCCLYEVRKSYWRGLFVDQKYLDLVPVKFQNVEIIKNRGCNFSGWNFELAKITVIKDQVYINGDKLVFIHYSSLAMELFPNIQSYIYIAYNQYEKSLKKYQPNFRFKKKKRSLANLLDAYYYYRWKKSRIGKKFNR